MTTRIAVLALAAVGAWAAAATGAAQPRDLAGYRSWRALSAEPHLVPYELALLCRVTTARIEAARAGHGPHTNRWIKVYANPAASAVLDDPRIPVYPAGAMLAKEKLLQPADAHAEGVAFMIKYGDGRFAESGGWEFADYPAGGAKGSYDRCVPCHRAGATRDYVFASSGQAPPALPAPVLPKLRWRLRRVLETYYREAFARVDGDVLVIEHKTRAFLIHHPLKTGEWQEARETRGPDRGGILARIELRSGRYDGAAVLPQTFDDRYFKTLVMAEAAPDGSSYLYVHLSYPDDANPAFLAEFQDLVRGAWKRQP
jgi:hypothetical protein